MKALKHKNQIAFKENIYAHTHKYVYIHIRPISKKKTNRKFKNQAINPKYIDNYHFILKETRPFLPQISKLRRNAVVVDGERDVAAVGPRRTGENGRGEIGESCISEYNYESYR